MSYHSDCLKKFNKIAESIKQKLNKPEIISAILDLEKRYKINFSFILILVFIGELRINYLPDYLVKKFSINKELSLLIKKELLENIFIPVLGIDEVVVAQKTEELLNIFKNKMLGLFEADEDELAAINNKIIYTLSIENLIDQKDLEKSLLSNQEQIGSENILLDKKSVKPTIGHWLEDFISTKGTESQDNLSISDYLINAGNTKILNSTNKNILRKVIKTYTNIKFFPDSMPDDFDKWTIVSVDDSGEDLTKTPQFVGPPKTREEKEIDELKAEEEKYSVGGLERLAIEEELKNKKKTEKLRVMAEKYKAGSLERRAIEEEIRKLEGRS